MSLNIEKVDENNINVFYEKISTTMYAEYCQTYNNIDNVKYFKHIREYILQHTYVLLWNKKLLGYFSLSPRDLNEVQSMLSVMKTLFHFYYYGAKTYYLFDVFVFPKYRKKGIGQYLVRQAVLLAKVQGATMLKLYALTPRLVSFYNKNNFQYSGCKTMYNKWMMLLELKLT